MNSTREKICCLGFSLAVSVLLHVLILSRLGCFGPHDFAMPVMMEALVDINLKSSILPQTTEQPEEKVDSESTERLDERIKLLEKGDVRAAAAVDEALEPAENESDSISHDAKLPEVKGRQDSMENIVYGGGDMPEAVQRQKPRKVSDIVITPPLRTTSEFLATDKEKITYRISLLGMPVGSAELEAKNENNEVRISLRVNSNPVVASIYPVEDLIETRHVGGNYILSEVRQQEGAFKSDRGFTVFLREKNVFWIDRLTNKSVRESIPNSDVVDVLSGLYYLRNRPLTVGTTETLHIYDSDTYAAVPVEVLRREKITLPGFRQVYTLVIQPKLRTEGFFRRTGDVLIWVTDDEYRVPVRIETVIALGRVTAELVSAESKRFDRVGVQ